MVNQSLSELPEIFAQPRKPLVLSNPQTSKIKLVAQISVVVLALGFTLVYGWYKLSVPESKTHLRVALVQANVLTWNNMPVADQEKHLQPYEGLTREIATSQPDLIVWPSSSLPAPIRYSRLVNFNVRRLAIETRSYLLVGGAGMEKFGPSKEGFLPFSNTFLSICSNDLAQFVFAADRGNAQLQGRYDTLSPAFQRLIGGIIDAGIRHGKPISVCGEIAGDPIDAMALLASGLRTFSMAPPAIGPIRAMIRSLDLGQLKAQVAALGPQRGQDMRSSLRAFARDHGVSL